jgi:hypothetical protein
MRAPSTADDLLELCRTSGLVSTERLNAYLAQRPPLPKNAKAAASALVKDQFLTSFQTRQLLAGRHKGFFLGPYKLLDQIGKGGMGAVFLCEHVALRRRDAVKVFPQERAKDPGALERFHREARAAAALDHPNIVRAYDVSQAHGVHFLAMEYVKGLNLEELLRRDGPQPFRAAVGYAIQAAAGLQHAFEKGVVHRDIKPANLLLDEKGVVKILDMGLARFFDDEEGLTQRLDQGAVMGTADYLPPEQATGSNVDIRADIYALGSTLYTLIKGAPPFSGPTAYKLIQIQVKEPDPLHETRPDVPAGLAAVVSKMMAKDPADRYQTPNDVIAALAPWAGDLPAATAMLAAKIKASSPRFRMPPPRVIALAGVGAAILIGLLVLAFGGGKNIPAKPIDQTPPGPKFATAIKPADTQNRRCVYWLDLSKTPQFRSQMFGRNMGDAEPPNRWPSGWTGQVWKEGSLGEFSIEGIQGSLAMCARNLEGQPAAEIRSPANRAAVMLGAGKRYTVRIDYLTPEGPPDPSKPDHPPKDQPGGKLELRLTDPKKADAHVDLKETKGTWKSAEMAFDSNRDQPLALNVLNFAPGPDNGMYVRALEVFETVRGLTPSSGTRLDFQALQPFLIRKRHGDLVNRSGPGDLPAPWFFDAWKEGSEVELAAVPLDGTTVLSLNNVGGDASGQFWYWNDRQDMKLKGGHNYRFRFEYLANAKASGGFDVRIGGVRPKGADSVQLKPTDGNWATAEVVVHPTADSPTVFFFQNYAAGPDTAIMVRWVDVVDLGEAPRAAAAAKAPAPPKANSLYRLDLSAVRPFSRRTSKNEWLTGSSGGLPPGWMAGAWNDSTVGEVYSEKVDGSTVIGTRTLEGEPSVMLFVGVGREFEAGRRYALRVEYQAPGGAERYVKVASEGVEAENVGKLYPTQGWKSAEIVYQPPRRAKYSFEFHNSSGRTPAESLFFRKVEVVELNGQQGAAPPAADIPQPKAQTAKEAGRLPELPAAVARLVTAPEGKLLLACCRDGSACLFDIDGEYKKTVRAHVGSCACGAFTHDGGRFATGGGDHNVRVWDAMSGAELHKLTGHEGVVHAVAFTPDGRFLASAGDDRVGRLWDLSSGECVRQFTGHTGAVTGAAFTPDGKTLVTTSEDCTCRFWSFETGEPGKTLAFSRPLNCLAVGPDGWSMAVAGAEGTLGLIDAKGASAERRFDNKAWKDLLAVALSADGRLLAASGSDERWHLIDTAVGKTICDSPPHAGPDGPAVVRAVAFTPDGRHLLSADDGRALPVWELPESLFVTP